MNMESISTTQSWFDIWLDAFGSDNVGIWRPDGAKNDIGIPYKRTEQRIGRIVISAATGAVNSHTPRYDILGELNGPNQVMRKMMRDLDVAMLTFPLLSRQSKLLQMHKGFWKRPFYHLDFCESSPYVSCIGNWDDYWGSRGKKTRQEYSRNERRLMEKNSKFLCITSKPDAESLLEEVLAVEASGWKGKEKTAILCDQKVLIFYRHLVSQWAQAGLLRLFLLQNYNEEIIAFQLCGLYKGVLTSLKIGYRQDYYKLSPGQVLQLQILRWAFAQSDVDIFDMLGPATPNKLIWSTDQEDLYTLQVFRPNAPGLTAWLRFVIAPAVKSKIIKRQSKPLIKL